MQDDNKEMKYDHKEMQHDNRDTKQQWRGHKTELQGYENDSHNNTNVKRCKLRQNIANHTQGDSKWLQRDATRQQRDA